MTFRVIVTGSRHWKDPDPVHHDLDLLLHRHGSLIVVNGRCPGGLDLIAHLWAEAHEHAGVISEPYPADWDHCGPDCPNDNGKHRRRRPPGDIWHPGSLPTYCPKAGPRRNAVMVARGGDLCRGWPLPGARNYGTNNCMRLAAAARILVRRYPQEV